jgi:hypothetical protein
VTQQQPRDGFCDACGLALDPLEDVGRFRHRGCKPPAFPAAALAVFEKVNRMSSSRRSGEVVAGGDSSSQGG